MHPALIFENFESICSVTSKLGLSLLIFFENTIVFIFSYLDFIYIQNTFFLAKLTKLSAFELSIRLTLV